MKKTLLTLALVAASATVFAQEGLYIFPEFYFDKMSPDGKVLATQTEGTVYMYTAENDQYYGYDASDDAVTRFYAIGVGNCISNEGTIVGGVNDATCAYWKDGEWHALPLKSHNKSLNLANGITPDGSRIVGVVGGDGMSFETCLMLEPVLWQRNADGTYDEYITLPYPATDFCGRIPQYIKAITISDDGKTVVGQIRDWSGFYNYPIIYTEDAEGNWSYKTIAAGILYPTDAYFGEWPGDEPARPDGTQFMTEEEKAEYLANMAAYQVEYEQFLNGEITWEELSEEPMVIDFINDNARKQEYLNAMEEYETILDEYYRKANAFEANLNNIMYVKNFTFNNVYLSGNGRYAAFTIEWIDMENFDPMNVVVYSTPTSFDLEEGTMTQVEGADFHIASSIMDDGRMIIQDPYQAYGRNSYIAAADGKSFTSFYDYMAGYDASIAAWMKEFSVFDVITINGVDQYGDPNYVVVEDSIVTGSVHCNSDGTVFTSFMYDEWSDYPLYRQYTYQINLNERMAVDRIEQDATQAYVSGNVLYLQGDVREVAVYDMRGAVVCRIVNPHNAVVLDINAGIYVVAVSSANGTETIKVVVE